MDEARLVAEAVAAMEHAYAPYSKFRVGAALLAEDGRVFRGSNVENVSFGLTVCAERIAIFNAVSSGCRKFSAIAVVADLPGPCTPCGACRQVIAEFDKGLRVIMANTSGKLARMTLSDLLPLAYGPGDLLF